VVEDKTKDPHEAGLLLFWLMNLSQLSEAAPPALEQDEPAVAAAALARVWPAEDEVEGLVVLEEPAAVEAAAAVAVPVGFAVVPDVPEVLVWSVAGPDVPEALVWFAVAWDVPAVEQDASEADQDGSQAGLAASVADRDGSQVEPVGSAVGQDDFPVGLDAPVAPAAGWPVGWDGSQAVPVWSVAGQDDFRAGRVWFRRGWGVECPAGLRWAVLPPRWRDVPCSGCRTAAGSARLRAGSGSGST
jgi:hypothetical protein